MGLDFSATPNNYVPCRGACLRRDVTRDSGKGRGIGLLRYKSDAERFVCSSMQDSIGDNLFI